MSNSESPSTFTTRPGAVGNPPQHYGNPLGEQRSLAAGDAIVDLSDRAVITVTGVDRLSWLDSLTSQSVKQRLPGEPVETLLLDPSGRLEFAIRLVDDGETTWLLVDHDEGAPLAAWLDRMRFTLRVDVADRSADFATIGTLGEVDLPAVVTWRDPWTHVAVGGHQYADVSEHPAADWTYREVVVDRSLIADDTLDDTLAEIPAAGSLALEALRIAAWRPRLATEADERTIPHELDWLRSAVHLSKGCYRGQETVAKVHNLGHPPRRLVMLHLDGSEAVLPLPGDHVMVSSDAPAVGRITSVALHYELGPIALAVIKRTVDPTATLTVRSGDVTVAAAQEVIVPPEAGASANIPKLPRLGAVRR